MEQKTEASQAVDERQLFEGWCGTERYRFVTLNRLSDNRYAHPGIEADWKVWQARAALKAQPAPTEAAQGEDSARLDVVVEANRALLHERSQLGIKKYGGTLGEKQYPHRELLTHALLEALDMSNYLQAAIMGIDRASAETGGVKP